MTKKKKILIASGAVVGVLGGLYIGTSVYFMNHFFPGSKINDVKVAGSSIEEAQKKVDERLSEYVLTIVESDGTTDTISAKDIDLSIEWKDQTAEFIEGQNGFTWVQKLFKPKKYSLEMDLTYNEEKLNEKINTLSCMVEEKQIQPINATISVYDASTGFSLVPSVKGTAINKEVFDTTVKDYLLEMKQELVLEEALCYNQPEIADDHAPLLEAIESLNKYVSTVVTYEVGSSKQVLDASTFANWFTFVFEEREENKKIAVADASNSVEWLKANETFKVDIDDTALTDYVKSLESKYNTAYKSKKLKTSYGSEVTISSGHYGWKINRAEEKQAIKENIFAGEPITRDLNYSQKANSHEGNDYGNSYVEINLTAQHLFLYVDGKLVLESDFVSGNTARGWGSPSGAYPLTYKERNATLNGADYSTPVDYWMPFAGNVGMHDATWRSDFGGTIYKRNGSHGCINLPHSAAQKIFQNIDTGFPVLCYKLPGTESPKGIAQDAAYKVIDAIKAIGTVTLEKESKITDARNKYNALSETGKKYVTNYSTLTNAEATLKSLKEAQKPVEPEVPSTETPATQPTT